MLALAPTPIQQHPPSIQFHSHHPSPSATRPPRTALSRSSSSSAPSASSSSSSTVSATSAARSSHREGPSSPPRSAASAHLPAYAHPASSRANGDAHARPPSDPAAPAAHRQASGTAAVDLHAFDSQELLRLLASLLAQIATTNDGLGIRDPHLSQSISPPAPPSPVLDSHHPPIWRTLTTASRNALSSNMSLTFHARNVPTITLEAYLLRILKYCPASNEVFLSLLVYFDRMSKLAKEACGKDFVIDSYNIHRLVIAGVTVASKFFSDVFYTNSRYAKVGGLPQTELNQLELQFLLLNDFTLMISKEEMQRYAEQLVHFSSSQQQQDHRSQAHAQAIPQHPAPHPTAPALPTLFTPPAAMHAHGPSGPAKFMSAVDGYREPSDSAYDAMSSQSHSPTQSAMRQAGGAGNRTPQMHATRAPSQSQTDAHAYANYQGQYAYDQGRAYDPGYAQTQAQGYEDSGRAAYRRSSSAYSTFSEASEAETDLDGSTDDEPTIRPDAASIRSMSVDDGDTMSMRSVSVEDDDEDDVHEREDGRRRDGEGAVGGSGGPGTPGERERARVRGGERSRGSSDGGREGGRDYRMTSP